MNIRRIWTLIKTEILHGSKDVTLIMAVVVPVLLALFANLAFGNIFTDRGKLGIYDAGNSQLPVVIGTTESIIVKHYETEIDLKKAAGNGAVDMGIVLPADFDTTLAAGTVKLTAYIWGESLAKNRAIIPVALADAMRELTGAEVPVNIETVALGDESNLPWSSRLLPLTVLLAVFFGGLMIPASSLIHEKQKRTLEALNVTPATIGDIFWAKGIIGAFLAFIMALITLTISRGFGNAPLALLLVLALGAVMAAEVGLLAGAFIRDMNTLFATWKFGGLLLFGPALVFMFPQIPAWVGYIFPTFYLVKPVMDISVNGLGFGAVAVNTAILAAIVLLIGIFILNIARRLGTQALRLNS